MRCNKENCIPAAMVRTKVTCLVRQQHTVASIQPLPRVCVLARKKELATVQEGASQEHIVEMKMQKSSSASAGNQTTREPEPRRKSQTLNGKPFSEKGEKQSDLSSQAAAHYSFNSASAASVCAGSRQGTDETVHEDASHGKPNEPEGDSRTDSMAGHHVFEQPPYASYGPWITGLGFKAPLEK